MSFMKFICIAVSFTMAVALSTDQQSALNAITESTNQFAFDFYKVLSSGTKGNVFTSPLSLQVVLALVSTGAAGKSASEIKKVLGLPDDKHKLLTGYGALVEILSKSDVLNLATRMFVDQEFKVKDEFQKNAEGFFKSDAAQVDYKHASGSARSTINDWVEKKTNNKIKNLIAEGILNADTVLVLVNAVHFKAKWNIPFQPRNTFKDKFFTDESNNVQVDMMHLTSKFNFAYNDNLKAKILELPYSGNEFSMFIILPDERTGLHKLETDLSSQNFTVLFKSLSNVKVDVTLPKFTMTQTMDLNDILKAMGINQIFEEDGADFSGISDKQLFVSKVIQKAFVAVDEEGTEAAAATGVIMMMKCSLPKMEEIQVFKADHPFIFVISKNMENNNLPLFFGSLKTI